MMIYAKLFRNYKDLHDRLFSMTITSLVAAFRVQSQQSIKFSSVQQLIFCVPSLEKHRKRPWVGCGTKFSLVLLAFLTVVDLVIAMFSCLWLGAMLMSTMVDRLLLSLLLLLNFKCIFLLIELAESIV